MFDLNALTPDTFATIIIIIIVRQSKEHSIVHFDSRFTPDERVSGNIPLGYVIIWKESLDRRCEYFFARYRSALFSRD